MSERAKDLPGAPGARLAPRHFLLLLLGLALALTACSKSPSEPPRPKGVPEQAIWVGGADGGVFTYLERRPSDPAPIYRATIYDDVSGSPLFQGRMVVVPQDRSILDLRNPALFSGWDGQALHLTDGRRLVRVRP